ncbi:MAG: GAF domain-containing sensor histidine kinase [Bdellovibrionaceae bacterium]|nr:GAF domain-containing sensor histidine kinase [Pseudobdellovibrionaceae bacterium]
MSLSVEGPSQSKIREAQFQFGRLMREINHKITAGDEFKSILNFLFDSLDTIIPYDRIGIALIEDGQLCAKWMRSKLPSGNLGPGYSGPLAGSSLKQILETGQPRIINDLVRYGLQKPESESTKLALKDGIKSSLTCPVYSDGAPVGVVFFSSGKPDTYKSEHIETYLEIADELSFVISQDRIRREAVHGRSTSQNVRMLLHDLKSPLGVIQGFLQIAQDEAWYEALDQDAKKVFETLQRNAFHMHDLLNELAELNHLNFHGNKAEECLVVLKEFFSEIATAAQDLASKKSISFRLECGCDLPEKTFFDPLKIRRAIDNLLSNAVKYSARDTSIRLVINARNEQLHVDVIDQGLGIPEGEFPKLFQEFGKTSVRPTEGESSSGIGLAIVKKIVEQHGGQISMSSEVGKGSTFSFWIPVAKTK